MSVCRPRRHIRRDGRASQFSARAGSGKLLPVRRGLVPWPPLSAAMRAMTGPTARCHGRLLVPSLPVATLSRGRGTAMWTMTGPTARMLAVTCRHLPPLAATCHGLPPLATTCRRLPPLAAACRRLPGLAKPDSAYPSIFAGVTIPTSDNVGLRKGIGRRERGAGPINRSTASY